MTMSDGPHGLRRQAGAGDHLGLNASLPATCFPTAAGVANSWDEALGEEIGEALAEEAVTMGVNVILGPGLNIKRSPLCGRNFEYFQRIRITQERWQQPMCVESRVKESPHVQSTLRQTARSLQMDPGGGLFVIVSNLITVLKYLLLLFLPLAFAGLPKVDFGFPGIDITLFGETFKWNIIGYDAAHGGLPYFCAYMIAMVVGECINFPIQRNFVFRSKGKVWYQAFWYLIAFCIVTCIVNSINCIWVAVAGMFVPGWLYNIGTTVLNGGVSMVVFFFVNKIIFPEWEGK